MLRLSKLADYATVIMVYLVNHKQLATAKQIAQDTHLQLPTVSKLLKELTHAELLDSIRGTNGGYQLASAAHKISVLQIICAIEGNISLTECSQQDDLCALEPHCNIQHNWRLINQAICIALAQVTLAELAKPMNKSGLNKQFQLCTEQLTPREKE